MKYFLAMLTGAALLALVSIIAVLLDEAAQRITWGPYYDGH